MLCQWDINHEDDVAEKLTPELQSERSSFAHRKTLFEFAAHMSNSMCRNGTKVINALDKANIIRAAHPVYSPDLSPCDFWLFGMLTHRMMDMQLQSPKKILNAAGEAWYEVTFEELRNVPSMDGPIAMNHPQRRRLFDKR
jgi:hypothetical protein